MTPAAPGAVLLDLDGTLVDRELAMAEAVDRVCARAGVPLAPGDAGRLAGRSWPDVHAALAISALPGWDLAHFLAAVLDEASQPTAIPVGLVPGAGELIARLVARGVLLGLVTGSTAAEVAGLDPLLAVEAFSVVVTADDVVAGKPAPDGYRQAAAALGVDPARCVAVEDTAVGVAAAHAAGMAVVGTTACNPPPGHPAHQDLSGADALVAALDELTDEVLAAILG